MITQISPRDQDGLLTLYGASIYLETCPPLNVTHDEFWNTMIAFLNTINNRILEKRKQNGGR